MNIRVEQLGPCRRALHVEVPVDQVSKEFADVVGGYVGVARIPGFRAGKAPREMVKRRFAKEISEEIKQRLVPAGYQEAIKQEKLQAVTVLNVEEKELKEGQAFSFTITVDVAPDFELPKYKGLKFESKSEPVADKDIDAVIKNIREQNVKYHDVADRAVQMGDMVQVDFTGLCEGKPFSEYSEKAATLGSAKDFWVIADAENEFLPGFAEGLVGAKVGDQKKIEITLSSAFIESSVAGKKASFDVSVKALREKVLPPMDEEFFKSMGVENEAAFRERIKTDLAEMRTNNERQRIESEIVKTLTNSTKLDVPESVLQEETQQAVYDLVKANTSRGVKQEEIEAKKEELFGAASQSAAERIKARYILRKIASTENIVATEDEINKRVSDLARQYRMTVEMFQKDLEKNNSLGRVADEVRLLKTVSWLYDQSKIEAA